MALYYQPPPPFIGGTQPLASRKLPPSETAVPVNDPPFTGSARQNAALAEILVSWVPPPPAPQAPWKLAPSILAVPENDPPFGLRSWLGAVQQAWQPTPVVILGASKLVPAELPVAFTFDPRRWLNVVLRTWDPILGQLPIGKLSPSILSVPEDAPPLSGRAWLATVLRAWDPVLGPMLRPPQFVSELIAAANPPFTRAWLTTVLRAWEPSLDPWITLGKQIVSVDDPPFGSRAWLSRVLSAWQPDPVATQALWKLIAAVPEDAPPVGVRGWLPIVVRAWDPVSHVFVRRLLFPQELVSLGIVAQFRSETFTAAQAADGALTTGTFDAERFE